MENEINETNVNATWDDIEGGYVNLEQDKAKILLLTDWKLNHIEKFKDKNGNLRKQIEFTAKVLSEDGKPSSKTFSTTSIGALKGLKNIFLGRKNEPVQIRIKKMGEGIKTIYDVEEQQITYKYL